MQCLQSFPRVIVAGIVAALVCGTTTAAYPQATPHLYVEQLNSRDDATTLPAFEIAPGVDTPDEARRQLMKALSAVSGTEVTGLRELPQKDGPTRHRLTGGEGVWQGMLQDDPNIGYSFNPRTGRLDIVNNRTHHSPPDVTARSSFSEAQAVAIAMGVINSLHEEGIVNKEEFDLVNLQITTQRTGNGVIGQLPDSSREQIVDYRITAPRQLNGVPVVGSFIRSVVHNSGAISELNLAYRPLKATVHGHERGPMDRGTFVPIDRTPEQAKQAFERAMNPGPDARFHVERWGLAYLDTGSAAQQFYQPAYVFLVTPLTETPEGTVAARKLVRAVPASSQTLEELRFDPLSSSPLQLPRGDARQ